MEWKEIKQTFKDVWNILPERAQGFIIGMYTIMIVDIFSESVNWLSSLFNNNFLDFLIAIFTILFIFWFFITLTTRMFKINWFKKNGTS